MSEKFPTKKPGDSLEAQHVNDLSGEARSVAGFSVSGGLSMSRGKNFISIHGPPRWKQYVFEISNLKVNDDDTDDSGMYLGKVRYFEFSETKYTGEWKTDDEQEWELDASGLGVSFSVGDKLVAWWDAQRGMFVPCFSSSLTPRILYDDAVPGGTDINAYPVLADMTADTAATKVLVQNTHPGNFRGYGDAHTGFDATTAAKVWTTVDLAGKEQIVYGKGLAKLCRAVAKAAISGASGTVDAVTVMDDGQSPVDSASTELSVNNPWNFYLADDALCQITRNGSGWDITNVALVAETFETEEQISGYTYQGKHREIRINPTGAESGWGTWGTGEACPT